LRLFFKLPLKNATISRRQFSRPSLAAGGKFVIIFSKLLAAGASGLVNKRSDRFEAGGKFVICFFKRLARRRLLARQAMTSGSSQVVSLGAVASGGHGARPAIDA
jgi:hypothetical protein